jgi:hypothetical protein
VSDDMGKREMGPTGVAQGSVVQSRGSASGSGYELRWATVEWTSVGYSGRSRSSRKAAC